MSGRQWMRELESGNDRDISTSELDSFRAEAVDGYTHGPIIQQPNSRLSNSELVETIQARIAAGKPVGQLLAEYSSRVQVPSNSGSSYRPSPSRQPCGTSIPDSGCSGLVDDDGEGNCHRFPIR